MTTTRPHIFYKYFGYEFWLDSLLEGRSLKFSSRATFNDPVDSRPAYQVVADSQTERSQLNEMLRQLGYLNPSERLRKMEQMRRAHANPAPYGTNQEKSVLDKIGILCLAPKWNNMLLWAHYANMHRGLCVGFHSSADIFPLAQKVRYSEELPLIQRPADDPETVIMKALYTKAKCWEYEEEWRILKHTFSEREQAQMIERCLVAGAPEDVVRARCAQRGPGIYSFDKRAIESITLGLAMPSEQQDHIISSVKRIGLAASIFKIDLPTVKYDLTRKQIWPLSPASSGRNTKR
jgi:hypothetical protein